MTVYRVKIIYGFYEEVFYEHYSTEEQAEKAMDYYNKQEDFSADYYDIEVAENEIELDDY